MVGLSSCSARLNQNYQYLDPTEVTHFLEHGWIRIPNAIAPPYVDKWMADLFVRLDMDPDDKSTWSPEYQHMPRHREVPARLFCPEAWEKIVELCGGGLTVENRVDEGRETWYGDAFIVNMGSEAKTSPEYQEPPPSKKEGWHMDDDWYRLFLDSEGTALTLVHCFSDIPPGGGGTWICEDGIAGVNNYLFANRNGLDPPVPFETTICADIRNCKRFTQLVANKGDIIILHGRLPHTVASNRLHFPRVITNPHVVLKEPMCFSREDGNYSLVEQIVMKSLDMDEIQDFKPRSERKYWYPRNQGFKRPKAEAELKRMEAAAVAKGLPKESVESFYQKRGSQEWIDFERRNGFDKELPESGLLHTLDGAKVGLERSTVAAVKVT